MKTNPAGIELIKRFEGCSLVVYKDQVGFPTIGIGHLIRPGEDFSAGITEQQAEDLLRADLGEAEGAVSRLCNPKTSNQFSALVSFTFNLGAAALQRSTLRMKLGRGDIQGAADEFPKWNKAGGRVLSGLTLRRMAERELFLRVD